MKRFAYLLVSLLFAASCASSTPKAPKEYDTPQKVTPATQATKPSNEEAPKGEIEVFNEGEAGDGVGPVQIEVASTDGEPAQQSFPTEVACKVVKDCKGAPRPKMDGKFECVEDKCVFQLTQEAPTTDAAPEAAEPEAVETNDE